jgi:hypothetical protein
MATSLLAKETQLIDLSQAISLECREPLWSARRLQLMIVAAIERLSICFADALNTAAGNHLLIYNGLYLTNLRLGRPAAANEISSKLVEYALTHKRLAIKFPFKPGTTAYSADQISGSYWMWLKQIARHTARSNACLEITGHSSATGAETLNERLSQLRAEYVKKQLERQSPRLRGRLLPAVLALAKIYWGPAKTI